MVWLALPGWLVVALEVACGFLAGAVFGAPRWRRVASSGLAALGLAIPFLGAPSEPVARALAGLGAMLGVMRVVEALRTRGEPPIPRALAFVLAVDLAHLRRAPPRIPTDALGRALVHGLVLAVGLLAVSLRDLAGAAAPIVAWLGGVVALYGAVDCVASALRALLAMLGVESAPMQRDPVLSASVSEFWAERWNRAVGGWLRRHVFLPVARRAGPLAGVAAAFAWSALLHFYAVLAGIGIWPALRMGAFFVAQALAVLLETRLSVRTWPRPLGRVWTFALVLGPSILFVGPVLEIFGVG